MEEYTKIEIGKYYVVNSYMMFHADVDCNLYTAEDGSWQVLWPKERYVIDINTDQDKYIYRLATEYNERIFLSYDDEDFDFTILTEITKSDFENKVVNFHKVKDQIEQELVEFDFNE
jgi:hypothetical protein